MSRVVLYGKPGCHLCEEALEAIERVRARTPFELEQVDVSLDPALHRLYGERIPVVTVDGAHLSDFHVDEAELGARVARVGA